MKDKITTFLFIIFIASFSIAHIIIKDEEISYSERRKLNTFPKFKLESDYITSVDKYLLDHFPLRDEFRSLKARFNYDILKRLDNNDIYIKDNYIYKSNYPTNKKSIESFKQNINKLSSMFTTNNKVYMMLIPDKNYYLNDKNFLNIDYDYIYDEVESLNIEMINLRDTLNINDYYQTDTHWKQENLDKVVLKMSEHMNFSYEKINYTKNEYDKFYGVYYGESAIKRQPEKLYYLTNLTTSNAQVKYLENKELTSVYSLNKLNSTDAYEVYLDGASSFIEISNPNNKSGKELVIFRDSFASSLSPLLIEYYSKITIIDNRYISSENFKNYISFNNQDILFVYSALIVNNSSTLKG